MTVGACDLVAIDLPAPAAAGAITACWASGEAVVVLESSGRRTAEILELTRPTVLLDGAGRTRRDGDPVPGDLAAVVPTSGTEGRLKAAALTRTGMEAMARAYTAALGGSPADHWLAVVPLSGVAGLAIVARAHVTGIPITVHAGFDPAAVADAAASGAASLVSLVPTMLRRLIAAGAPLDRFRVVLVGGAPLPGDLAAAARDAGVNLVATYGMTETWGGFALEGRPLPGAEVRIGAGAEIEVRGPMVARGYHRDPEATATAFGSGGWYRTGDAGAWDGTTLRVTARLRDLIITGGVNVAPARIEAVMASHAGVVDVAVSGIPDPEWGERVIAYVVPGRPPPDPAGLRRHAADHLTPAEVPARFVFVGEIPRNAAGKVLRDRLPGPESREAGGPDDEPAGPGPGAAPAPGHGVP